MSPSEQNFANHAKTVPMYHLVGSSLVTASLVWFVYRAATDFTFDHLFLALTLVAVAIVHWYARTFALGVQDRVIRLEERLRMERVFPDDLRTRIEEFTTAQLIALRFASDDELAGLARRVLDENIRDRKSIKAMIRDWRPDHQRI